MTPDPTPTPTTLPAAPPPTAITLALLAGGRGTRMGGPKSHLRLAGLPILQYLHARLAWPGPTLLITAPGAEHPPAAHLFTAEIPDPVPDQGPLRGIHTALSAATTDLVVFTTVDMPNVTRPHLLHLAHQLASLSPALGLLLRHPANPPSPPLPLSLPHPDAPPLPQIEPFPSAFSRHALPEIARRLQDSRLSVQSLSADPRFALQTAPPDWPPTTWLNLNHPHDLTHFTPNHPPQ